MIFCSVSISSFSRFLSSVIGAEAIVVRLGSHFWMLKNKGNDCLLICTIFILYNLVINIMQSPHS